MKKLVVDTDILFSHVLHADPGVPSELRWLMGLSFCYTTVFNAVEAFGLCRNEEERRAVQSAMSAMKILGLNAKSGKNLGGLFSSYPTRQSLQLLIAGVCLESRLPLVTRRKGLYRGIAELRTLTPAQVHPGRDRLRASRREATKTRKSA